MPCESAGTTMVVSVLLCEPSQAAARCQYRGTEGKEPGCRAFPDRNGRLRPASATAATTTAVARAAGSRHDRPVSRCAMPSTSTTAMAGSIL